jgi:molecular chaperone HscA
VDADGILEVTAVEQLTGARSEVIVKPAFGLDETQITEMLKASYEFAAEDMTARQLAEARVEGEALLAGLQSAMAQDGDLLVVDEVQHLKEGMQALQGILAVDDPQAIREMTEQVGRVSEDFAARRMDRSIQSALKGVSLTSLDADQTEERSDS